MHFNDGGEKGCLTRQSELSPLVFNWVKITVKAMVYYSHNSHTQLWMSVWKRPLWVRMGTTQARNVASQDKGDHSEQ